MTDKQIIIKEITECGFYCSKDDTERLYIYEVIKNTDEEWLKENPEATLLIDEWIYDYTDCDDRKVYTTSGNLVAVCNNSATCKVYKIEDTKYKIYGNNGLFLIEDKPTYKDQLKAKEQECEELNADNISLRDRVGKLERAILRRNEQLDQLKAENDYLKHKIFRYEEIFKHSADMTKNPVTAIEVETFQSSVKALGNSLIAEENNKLHKTLTEIKEIAKNGCYDDCGMPLDELSIILQKISEFEVEDV